MKPLQAIAGAAREATLFTTEPVLNNFGSVARWMGFLTTRETLDAFAIQVHEEGLGQPRRPIGMICKELGFMTEAQIQEVLAFLNARRAAQ